MVIIYELREKISLKAKAVHGVSWSLIDKYSMLGINMVAGIILARLLMPSDFGLIGMAAIFTAFAQSFVDSGFSSALIQKKECTQSDYSTVFIYNLISGVCLYTLLYLLAPYISNFFNEPQLIGGLRIIGLQFVVVAISQIHRTRLIKKINFKKLAIISAISSIIASLIAISMAASGYGVWSIAVRLPLHSVIITTLLWISTDWRPSLQFSFTSFKELFGFGGKLLASGLLNKVNTNIYNIIIGKYFSAADLGFYSRAKNLNGLVGMQLSSVIVSVGYPVMASFGEDSERLRRNFKLIIMTASLLGGYLSLMMVAIADSFIITLLGDKWAQSIPYIQLLGIGAILYPISGLNLNLLKVKGRSDLFLKLEIYKKLLIIPNIAIGIIFGIIPMLIAMLVTSTIAFFMNSYYTVRLIEYSIREQIKDIGESLILVVAVAVPVYIAGVLLDTAAGITLGLQLFIGVVGGACILRYSKYPGAIELREIFAAQSKRVFQKFRKKTRN